jgi:hypothetical protein
MLQTHAAGVAVALSQVRKSVEEERKKLEKLRAARKLAEKRGKETAATRGAQAGYSLGWVARHSADDPVQAGSTELDELEAELQKEDLLLQQDRLRLQSGAIEAEEPEPHDQWVCSSSSCSCAATPSSTFVSSFVAIPSSFSSCSCVSDFSIILCLFVVYGGALQTSRVRSFHTRTPLSLRLSSSVFFTAPHRTHHGQSIDTHHVCVHCSRHIPQARQSSGHGHHLEERVLSVDEELEREAALLEQAIERRNSSRQ